MASALGGVLLLRAQVEEDEDPLLHCFPDTAGDLQRAARLKGLFLALAALTKTLAGANVRIASLSSKQTYNQSQAKPAQVTEGGIKAAYAQLGRIVMVVLLPSFLLDAAALSLAQSLQSSLRFILGPTARWMEHDSKCFTTDVTAKLTPLLQSWFDRLHNPGGEHESPQLMLSLPGAVPFFEVSSEIHAKLVEAVSKAETAGGTLHERCLRKVGWLDYREACLIHRGLVVYTDMAPEDTASCSELCQREGLLCRSKGQGQHISFHDVYVGPDEDALSTRSFGEGADTLGKGNAMGKRALLVVGLEPSLLCLLLQPESSSVRAEQLAESPELDAAVSQLLALSQSGTLDHLDDVLDDMRNGNGPSNTGAESGTERLSYIPQTGFLTRRGSGQRRFQTFAAALRQRLLLTQLAGVSPVDKPHGQLEKLPPAIGVVTRQVEAELSARFEKATVLAPSKKAKRPVAEKRDLYWITGRIDGDELTGLMPTTTNIRCDVWKEGRAFAAKRVVAVAIAP
ncbi:hypothetical protein KFL_004930050 [Klebsormidium nitens]|uniref:CCZ1/INTU/HSP4 first Longin domain-containing protein n=1 Tax=Klebsormidium nitens TaxID=105231 RepID=A0A1Y1IKG3_KLENI|nr:hypothetical protein KFL_004930050 [Klebsormidium nitens]|eukprot:GAQ89167.1 hypothetical protein KFL_004930050 [Klebsormidium nitens]